MDVETYAKMMEPLSSEQTNDNLIRFARELDELQEKYHIADIVCAVHVSIRYPDHTGRALSALRCGNSVQHVSMAAWLLGVLQSEHSSSIAKLLAGNTMEKERKIDG